MADAYGDPLLNNYIGHGPQHGKYVVHAICRLGNQRVDMDVLPHSVAMCLPRYSATSACALAPCDSRRRAYGQWSPSVILACAWHLRAVGVSMRRAAPCQPVDFGCNASFSC